MHLAQANDEAPPATATGSLQARTREIIAKSPQIYTVRCRSSLDHVHGGENGPGRNRQQDGKQEPFDRKLATALMRKLARQFA